MTTSTDKPLIQARGIGKRFKLYGNPHDRLREWLSFGRSVHHRTHWALRGIDLELRSGECLGVIGVNGSGKSTLLKLLSGSLLPTEGAVDRRGRVLALIELKTGFNEQLTGRENISYVGQMLGLSQDYLEQRTDDIIEFADLGQYIDQPARAYSSGMFARLSFSMYAFLEPDILMVDEVLAVGDAAFKRKCFDRIEELVKRDRCATIYVSHGMQTVARLADRVAWIHDGEIRDVGEPVEMINQYLRECGEVPLRTGQTHLPEDDPPPPGAAAARGIPTSRLLVDNRSSEPAPGRAQVSAVWLENPQGDPLEVGHALAPLTVCVAVEFLDATRPTSFRVALHDDRGNPIGECADTADPDQGYATGQTQILRAPLRVGLPAGRYAITTSCTEQLGAELLDQPPATLTVIAVPGGSGLPPVFGALRMDPPSVEGTVGSDTLE